MYEPNPNEELIELFRHRPYQGVEPEAATFLFVGLDANYARDLEHSECFRSVLEYHQDGAAFWRRYGVHHPFLLPSYRGDGRRYHRAFSRIGFGQAHADSVSFAELLDVPTVGRSALAPQDLSSAHLNRLNSAILRGKSKYIFVSAGVGRLMRASGAFPWLPNGPRATSGPLGILYTQGSRTVYSHLHFSNYGKFEQRLHLEALAIAALLPLA
jgi:hypothetical protein